MAPTVPGLSALAAMGVVFSGIKPTGEVHLGNYLGALRQWVEQQHRSDAVLLLRRRPSRPHGPAGSRRCCVSAPTASARSCWPSVSIPSVCTLFVQSHVHEHAELAWLLDCTASLRRAQPDDPVQGQVGSDRLRVRRAVQLPGTHGGRHPAVRHHRGAGRRRPAPTHRTDPHRGRTVQPPLRRRRSSFPKAWCRRSALG